MAISCPGTLSTDINGNPVCDVAWVDQPLDLTPITQLTDMLEYLFAFDAQLFGIVLFGCVLFFAKGWGIGVVMRALNKR